MAKKNENPTGDATERDIAPVTAPVAVAYVPPQPRQMRIENAGGYGEPLVRHYPQIRGGICEFCGVLDSNQPSQYQYKLCPHYRGTNMRCSYCPSEKDPDEVIRSSKLEVVEHPDRPGVMIVVCSSYECEKRHQERFRTAAR